MNIPLAGDYGGTAPATIESPDEAIALARGHVAFVGHLSGGAIGMTRLTTGPHLHFVVRRGTEPIDPRSFLPQR